MPENGDRRLRNYVRCSHFGKNPEAASNTGNDFHNNSTREENVDSYTEHWMPRSLLEAVAVDERKPMQRAKNVTTKESKESVSLHK